jgi:hypothetical protein
MHRRWAIRGVQAAQAVVALVVTTWSLGARATPEFPQAVVQDLGLPGITVGAPQGCTLCHPTDAGGLSLKPFGQLLLQNGVKPYDPSSLKLALDQVELEEPQLVDDIRAGRDPSSDTTDVHRPEYGCSAATMGSHAPQPLAPTLLAVGALLVARGLRRRSASRLRRRLEAAWE